MAGLLYCARCGRRMAVRYADRTHKLHHICRAEAAGCKELRHSITGWVLDRLVAEPVPHPAGGAGANPTSAVAHVRQWFFR